MKHDHFPPTASWIGRRLELGEEGLAEIRQHVMSVYNEPLMIYYKGCRDRQLNLGEPQEIVTEFFLKYVNRPKYFQEWQERGKSLAQWLRNGLHCHLNALKDKRKRDSQKPAPVSLPDDDLLPAVEDDNDREYQMNVVLNLARAATQRAEELCRNDGLGLHWEVLRRHYLEGQNYGDFVDELGITAERAAVMNRTAERRLGRATREVIEREMNGSESIEEIAQNLLEVLKS